MIQNQTTFVQVAGNGVTTTFNYPNKIFLATDLVVSLIQISTGQVTVQTLGTQYTIPTQMIDNDSGSQVVFMTAPLAGYTVDIRSDTPETQLTSIKNQGSFLPELHEEAFDKVTREVQDLYRLAYLFGLHGPDDENIPWAALPSASARANQWVGFNASGQPIVGSPTSSGGGSVTIPVYNAQTLAAGESDNLALPGASNYVLDYTPGAAGSSISGWVPQGDGQYLIVTNVGVSALTLLANSANSTVPIRAAANIVLEQNTSVQFLYSQGAGVWIPQF